jgi:antitoxin (DNA-binding transcriptional repressor) of toxin-antitoxin stability system
MEISKSQFKSKALELFRRVEADGERLVVTDRGTPTLEVRRYVDRTRAPLDVLRGTVVRYDRPTDPVADDDWDALR